MQQHMQQQQHMQPPPTPPTSPLLVAEAAALAGHQFVPAGGLAACIGLVQNLKALCLHACRRWLGVRAELCWVLDGGSVACMHGGGGWVLEQVCAGCWMGGCVPYCAQWLQCTVLWGMQEAADRLLRCRSLGPAASPPSRCITCGTSPVPWAASACS